MQQPSIGALLRQKHHEYVGSFELLQLLLPPLVGFGRQDDVGVGFVNDPQQGQARGQSAEDRIVGGVGRVRRQPVSDPDNRVDDGVLDPCKVDHPDSPGLMLCERNGSGGNHQATNDQQCGIHVEAVR